VRRLLVGLVLAGLALLVAQPGWLVPGLGGPARLVTFIAGSWLAYAVAAWLVQDLPLRAAVISIVLGGIALPLAAGFASLGAEQAGSVGPPRSSDDLYRYLWDGRVQAAGIDPYQYVPAAPELVGLRDSELWPVSGPWCVGPDAVDPDHGRPLTPGCSLINRPTVHTIYPPVAEALFFVFHNGRIQFIMALVAAATTVLLLIGLRSVGADPRRAALWAWCPLVAVEAGSNAHVDTVAVLLTCAAVLVLARARSGRSAAAGGVLFGLAIATKLTPALIAPALARRRPVIVATSALAAIAVVYLPHVLAVGAAVLGYLPGYLTEEGYTNGNRFALLTLVVPATWAGPVAVGVLLATAVVVARRTDPDRPWLAGSIMTGTALLVATPSYPWYALLLVALVTLGARPEWLLVPIAAQLAQYAADLHLNPTVAQRLGYAAVLVLLVGATALRAVDRRELSRYTRQRVRLWRHPEG
jgi:hypothetical protein